MSAGWWSTPCVAGRGPGWPLWTSLIIAAAIVLTYTTLGGLSAAIYNEVLQFFVIVAALLPLTILGLKKVGGYSGLKEQLLKFPDGAQRVSSWPGTNLTGIEILRSLRDPARVPPIRAKIIITTNLEQRDEVRADIENQADGYLVKAEITPRELVDFLNNLA